MSAPPPSAPSPARPARPTPRHLARLRRAWTRLRWPALALQALLLVLVGALLFAWISIPDSNSTEISLTVTLALGGLVAVAWAQTALFHLIYARHVASVRLRAVLSTLLSFLLFAVVHVLFTTALAILQAQLAARLTSALLLASILLPLNLLVWFALTLLALALLTLCIEAAATPARSVAPRAPFARSLAVLRSSATWPPLLAIVVLLALATEVALGWHPVASETGARLLGYVKVAILWPLLATGIAFLCSLLSTFLRDLDPTPEPAQHPHLRPKTPSRPRRF